MPDSCYTARYGKQRLGGELLSEPELECLVTAMCMQWLVLGFPIQSDQHKGKGGAMNSAPSEDSRRFH